MTVSVLDIFLISVGSFTVGCVVTLIIIMALLAAKQAPNAEEWRLYENHRTNTSKKGIEADPE